MIIDLHVSPALIQTILDGVMGASDYWASFGVESGFLSEPDKHGIRHYLRLKVYDEYSDNEGVQSEAEIGPDEIREGVRRVLLNDMAHDGKPIKRPHALCAANLRADLFEAIIDPEHEPDSWTIDAVLQAAVLGRIVYG